MMGRAWRFLKEWMLPTAMITGALTYKWVGSLSFLTPYLIFAMLLVTFCKTPLRDIRFHPAHGWLLLIQLAGSVGLYAALRRYDEIVAQGAMLCVLAPTATAAAVITGMLGGNVGFLTAYMLFCNGAVAIAAPIYFSLAGAEGGEPFLQSVWHICMNVLPLLACPLLTAVALKKGAPVVHRALLKIPRLTFYLWALGLMIVTGVTVRFMLDRREAVMDVGWKLLAASLALCCVQFLVGRRIGRRYGDAVSSGQGLGQKNTVLAIWMAQSFLHPLTAIAPAGYILWQNIINSYQLYRKLKIKN